MTLQDLTPERVAERLAALAAAEPTRVFSRAAVAAALRFAPAEVFLIERATRAGDRWSGHVAFPGGLENASDGDLRATAVRETREEVGLDLDAEGRLLGRLPPVRAIARGLGPRRRRGGAERLKSLPLSISPFVFHVARPFTPVPNHEVAGCFWLPLEPAAAGAFDDTYEHRLGPVPLRFPCWRYEGRVVWGLTFQMLRSLLAAVE